MPYIFQEAINIAPKQYIYDRFCAKISSNLAVNKAFLQSLDNLQNVSHYLANVFRLNDNRKGFKGEQHT